MNNYEQLVERVAQKLHALQVGSQWHGISEAIKDGWRRQARELLKEVLSAAQISALKGGGHIAVTDPEETTFRLDGSLADLIAKYGYSTSTVDIFELFKAARFRKVVEG